MILLMFATAVLALALAGPAHAVGSLAQVSVYDRSAGLALPIYWHAGQAYVVGTPGHEYRVTVRNRRGEDLLAVMSVDGVNVITGETAHPLQSGYVVGAGSRLALDGWRKSLSRTAAFCFTAQRDSYAARTGRPDNIGVIGVALFRRKAEAPQPFSGPLRAPAAAGRLLDGAKAEESLGTGHGRGEVSHARRVEFERATSHPAETVTIRYDSHRNLVAMGVIREAPRAPQPFPGFVPDA